MLTRILKTEIQKGMFVEAVECSEAVFRKRRFILNSDTDVSAILESSAAFVLINTAFGTDGGKASAEAAKGAGSKPLSPAEASATVARSVRVLKGELISMVTGGRLDMASIAPVVEEIAQADKATSSLFFQVSRLKHKDETTFQHSMAVSMLMGRLGDELDLDMNTVEMLVLAGRLIPLSQVVRFRAYQRAWHRLDACRWRSFVVGRSASLGPPLCAGSAVQ